MTYTDSDFNADEPAETFNPFPGLRPFETDEYTLFFGRDGQSDELLARLGRTRFLAVVGTSGSGKSSLIRAGLLPALHGGLMAGAGSAWRVALLRPGGDPIGNLAAALCSKEALGAQVAEAEASVIVGRDAEVNLRDDDKERREVEAAEVRAAIVEATLRRSTLGLVDVVRQARLAPYENLLVVVDQFEELFRFRASMEAHGSKDDAAAFVKLLLEAPQRKAREELAERRKQSPDYEPPPGQEVLPIYVVLTMRSDFLGDCSQFQGLPEAINDGQYLIPRMTRDERRAAITGPAAVGGGEISLPLVNRLLNDVGDNPDQLPIMQHALMRTWDQWSARCQNDNGRASCAAVELSDYEAVGGMADALSRHADEAFNELPDERSRLVAEKMFKALTEKGADNREIRRPATLGELSEIAEATPEEVASVIETFRRESRSFLMPPVGTPLTTETVIDISHESLIRNWERLKKWVDEEAQSARIYRRVAEAATLHGAGQESLSAGAGLQVALDWRDKARPNSAWASRYHPAFAETMNFLDESKAAHEAALAETERRREEQLARERRELEQAQKFAAEQQKSAQRLRRMIFAMVLVSLVALGAAGGAVFAYADARASRVKAEGEKERAEAESTRAHLAEQSAVEQKRLVEEERNRAQEAERKAEQERERAVREEAYAKEQEVIARRNAIEAARSAEDARRQAALAEEQKQLALEKRKQVQAAVERGEMIRSGLEAFRREDFPKALTEFEHLQAALKEFQRGGPSSRNVPPEQFKQFVRDYGWTHTRLGDTHFKRDELREAVAAYEKALPILESVVNPDEPAPILFETYHGLAHAYQGLAGATSPADRAEGKDADVYFAKAEEFFKRAAAYQQKHHSDQPLRVAAGYKNLAQLYVDMNNPAAAEENFKHAVEARRAAEKPPAAGTLGALKDLAEFYTTQGRETDAIGVYKEMIDIQEPPARAAAVVPDNSVGDVYVELGQIYLSMKDAERADAAFLAADKIQQIHARSNRSRDWVQAGGVTLIDVSDELTQLGDAYVTLGRYEPAERVYRFAGGIMEKLEEKKASRWQIYEKLAALANEHFKDYKKAEGYYKLMAEARSEGPEHAEAQRQLADLYANKLGNPKEAEEALMRAYFALAPRGAWEEIEQIFSALIVLHQRQNNETGLVIAHERRLNAIMRQRDTFRDLRYYRSPELPKFFATYAKALGEIADFYLSLKDDARAESIYRVLLSDAPDIFRKVSESAHLGGFATSLEKYQKLLLDSKRTDEAAKVEETIKEARARQKEMEQRRQ